METKLSRAAILKGLYLAQGISDRRSTNPALSNVLLHATPDNRMICAATDLRISMAAEFPAEVAQEGAVSVGAKHLFEIVKGLPSETLLLKKDANNWVDIQAAKTHYKVTGLSARDYPRLPDHREKSFSEVSASVLAEMISKTVFSVSTDDTRHHLSGVLFECNGELARMVSTDGHRLSKVERPLGKGPQLDKGVLIPRKGVVELRRFLEGIDGSCDLAVTPKELFVKAEDIVLSVALVDAQFPPYDRVVPNESEKEFILGRVAFLESLKRVSVVASERSRGIRIELSKGVLRMSSDNPDVGEAVEDIEVNYDGDGLVAGFNARYFVDVLGEISADRIVLGLSKELDPAVIRPEGSHDYVGVIMPMRI